MNIDQSSTLIEARRAREVIARAIYRLRPFRFVLAQTVMNGLEAQWLDWHAAPASYQEECRELADAALAGLAASGFHLEAKH